MQKWQAVDIESTNIDKSKHVHIEVGGSTPISLHFNAGSRDAAEAIATKLESSKTLSVPRPSISSQLGEHQSISPPSAIRVDAHKKGGASVRFAPTSPTVIPPRSPSEEEYAEAEVGAGLEVEYEPPADPDAAHVVASEDETADALYDFEADGEDELSVKEGEHLVVLERDGDEWWKCRNSEGTEGVVPASYLEVCWYLRFIFLPDFWTLDDLDEVYKAGGIRRLSCRLRYSLC